MINPPMNTYPTLYKRTNTGAIQQWTISVAGNVITTIYGQVGGALQQTSDTIREGKNLGKVNATTPEQQARAEAEAKWTKQLKKGYVQDIESARSGEVDAVIEGGIAPMLAPNKVYPQDTNLAKKIVFPAFIQPKLDGARCIATIGGGKASLWTRTRKPIRCVPHIVEALEHQFEGQTVTLDGELYNHDFRNSFEDLMSIIRKDEPDAEGLHRSIQYHVYDVVMDGPFTERLNALCQHLLPSPTSPLVRVAAHLVGSVEEALEFQESFEQEEYEGAMIRNAHGPYEAGKRSSHLQKMKTFVDGEFKIVGALDGRGKDAGTVAKFVCVTSDGKVFRPRLKATYARRRELLMNPSLWQGKLLTVSYKRFTADGVPYLPIGKAIRDYE